MTDPTRRNRLDEEASPYLRQHADNPVHWQPWDDAALEAARERDVPIFLSIGYSACHWCHVMAEESFDDEAVAAVLNEHFVPIKVDREERPDLDSIYQTVCQLVTGRGGWPLSVWLTPDGKPFYVGTYFPKRAGRGMPGFVDLLENVAHSWEADREEIENRADQWTAAARDHLEETPEAARASVADETVLTEVADAAIRGADREYGGFGRDGPKFPQPSRIQALLRAHHRTDRDAYLDVAVETLDAMADGGLYDHVGGGFHRYCVDRTWTVPHFEKMLYDNAELTRAYLAAHQLTDAPRYAQVARETLAFVERELTHPDGGFFATLDAQSEDESGEREEGAFYVWTPAEVEAALDENEGLGENGGLGEAGANLVCDRFGITASGNFEGKTVLTISRSIESLAEEHDSTPETIESQLDDAMAALFDAREGRPRPPRDEKVLGSWNGLMISAFAEAGIVLNEEHDEYAETAVGALTFVREHLWNEDERRLARRYKDGDVTSEGYLDDYAFLARAALDCYQATGDVEPLAFAVDLARVIVDAFWDADRETLYFTPADGESLVTRPQELIDQSTPSSAGVAVDALLTLDHFVPDDGFADVAERVLETHGKRIQTSPLEHATLALAADHLATGSIELTVAADGVPPAWRERIGETYLPNRVVARRPPAADHLDAWLDRLQLDAAPPIWAERDARDDEPTLYACQSFTCSPPVHDVEEALEWLAEPLDA